MAVTLCTNYLKDFIEEKEYEAISYQVKAAHELLHSKKGPGNDFLGWLDLPLQPDAAEIAHIKQAAEKIRKQAQVLIVIGIGGSYLGARASLEFLHSNFYNQLDSTRPEIYFLGNNLSATYLNQVLAIIGDRDVAVNVVSKSGTTTEPAVAFRIMKEFLEKKYGKEQAKERIYCTTDKARGTMKVLANQEGYDTFVIPDDVGGRFTVLTPCGLLPLAVSGADIDAMLQGAAEAATLYKEPDMAKNECYKYAAIRNILSRKGKTIELLVTYEPSLVQLSEWYKQLFGESEGKNGKGLFPASVNFSADLHSMGQYVQQGMRTMFETIVAIKEPLLDKFIQEDASNFDGLNFLADQQMSEIGKRAQEGTIIAHVEGGVPNILIEIEKQDEKNLGALLYFFEKACAISGYLLAVNPFDQPGVEDYKCNMFALLGKPGFERQGVEIRHKLEKYNG